MIDKNKNKNSKSILKSVLFLNIFKNLKDS